MEVSPLASKSSPTRSKKLRKDGAHVTRTCQASQIVTSLLILTGPRKSSRCELDSDSRMHTG